MTAVLETTHAVTRTTTTTEVRPRYEGSNICTWIGFKHVNYLVEEAVLAHFRNCGVPAKELYEEHALCVDIVDIDTRIGHAFHMDDLADATVRPTPDVAPGELAFTVTITIDRPGGTVKAVTSKVLVALRYDNRGGGASAAPEQLVPYVTNEIVRTGGTDRALPADLADLVAGENAIVWKWRIPYFYCHFTERFQMSGYLRHMEEVVDLFLAERGVSIKTLLDEQNWIPVVPHSRVTMLGEAAMEKDLYTVFTVERVFKDLTYTARVDWYVERDGKLAQTATGRITHGYALIDGRRDWSVVNFDERMMRGLAGPRPGGKPVVTGRGDVAESTGA